MKRLFLSLAAVFMLAFVLQSCGGDKQKDDGQSSDAQEVTENTEASESQANIEKDILGNWEIVAGEIANFDDMLKNDPESKGLSDEEKESMKKEANDDLQKQMLGDIFEFTEDNVNLHGPDYNNSFEKLDYNSDTKTFTLKDPEDGSTAWLEIETLNGDDLVMVLSTISEGMNTKIRITCKRKEK